MRSKIIFLFWKFSYLNFPISGNSIFKNFQFWKHYLFENCNRSPAPAWGDIGNDQVFLVFQAVPFSPEWRRLKIVQLLNSRMELSVALCTPAGYPRPKTIKASKFFKFFFFKFCHNGECGVLHRIWNLDLNLASKHRKKFTIFGEIWKSKPHQFYVGEYRCTDSSQRLVLTIRSQCDTSRPWTFFKKSQKEIKI